MPLEATIPLHSQRRRGYDCPVTPDPGGFSISEDSGAAVKTIITASGAFRTGTEIADAVTAYSLALARARAVDVVDIPFVATAGPSTVRNSGSAGQRKWPSLLTSSPPTS